MIFVDTGAFLARSIAQDQYHEKAVTIWGKIHNSQEQCLTSNFVLDEFITLLARRAGYSYAAERARNILSSRVFEILSPGHNDELEAVELFQKYADQKISFTDSVSFVLMRNRKIKRVFSFDNHFKLGGFHLITG